MSAFTENVTATNETAIGISRGFSVYSTASNDTAVNINKGFAVQVKAVSDAISVFRKGVSVAVSVTCDSVTGFEDKVGVSVASASAVTVTGEAAKSIIVGEIPVINAVRIMHYRRACLALSEAKSASSSTDGRLGNSKFYR